MQSLSLYSHLLTTKPNTLELNRSPKDSAAAAAFNLNTELYFCELTAPVETEDKTPCTLSARATALEIIHRLHVRPLKEAITIDSNPAKSFTSSDRGAPWKQLARAAINHN